MTASLFIKTRARLASLILWLRGITSSPKTPPVGATPVSKFKFVFSKELGSQPLFFVMLLKPSTKATAYPSVDTILMLKRYHIDALDFTGFPKKYGYNKLDKILQKNTNLAN